MTDLLPISGVIHWRLDRADGTVRVGTEHNIVTDAGAAFYAARMLGSATVITGMRLGTSATAPAKNGPGAAIGSHLPGSSRALDGIPTATGGTLTFSCTWPAGTATTTTAISEVVLVTDSITTDAASPAAATAARALINPPVVKAVGDTLAVTWTHTFGA